jgi:DNA-binding LacI/PurR family transcriptional regulator
MADRWAGFTGALTGGTRLALHVPTAGGEPSSLLDAVSGSGATAIFFTELADAIPFDRAVRSRGLSVPGDLSIIVLGSHVRPSDTGTRFTTFSIPREEMGRRATGLLVALLEGRGGPLQVLLGCERVVGETLGPIAGSGAMR